MTVATERIIAQKIRHDPERMGSLPTTPEEFVAVYRQSGVAMRMSKELESHLADEKGRKAMGEEFRAGVTAEKAKSVRKSDPSTVRPFECVSLWH